jgi:succinoglycan biosynthesis protein ExoM
LENQDVDDGWRLDEVLIVLNEPLSEAEQSIKKLRSWMGGLGDGKPVRRVVVEPTKGIPYARNRALNEAVGSWLAFIDDDCVATPQWLLALTRAADDFSAQAVAGGWQIVPQGQPSPWVPSSVWGPKVYFLEGADAREGQVIPVGYTRNVLFRIPKRASGDLALKFDPSLAETGGSDALFFWTFSDAGNKIVFWPNAHVDEFFDGERLRLPWHLRRRIRNTQSRLRRARLTGERRFNLYGGGWQLFVGLSRLPILVFVLGFLPRNPSLRRAIGRSLLNASVIAGVLLHYIGLQYLEYSSTWKWRTLRNSTLPSAVPTSRGLATDITK